MPKTNTTTSSALVTMRLYASQEAVQDAEQVHRPYVTRREKAIIESYAHPAREYLRGWEGDARLGEAVDSGADAAEVADQGKLVDRVVPVLNRSLESVGEVTLPGLIYDQPLRKVRRPTGLNPPRSKQLDLTLRRRHPPPLSLSSLAPGRTLCTGSWCGRGRTGGRERSK